MVITPKKTLPEDLCQITNGPSKYDLQASIFDRKVVQFSINTSALRSTMDIGEKFNCYIEVIGREDGSSESWVGRIEIRTLSNEILETRLFYYDTRNRRGTISERSKKIRWE